MALSSLPSRADRAGSTGAAFLQMGIGARAGAMGEAYTAWADDVYGLYFNPAGLARLDRQQIGLSHNTLFVDMDYDYLGYALPLPFGGTFGFSALYVDLGSVDKREIAAGGGPTSTLGTSKGSDLAFSLAYSRAVSRVIDLGGSLKVINETLGDHSATAVAIDLGAKWRPPVPGLTVGLSASNLGSSLQFVRVNDELPITLRAGAGYRSPSRKWGLTGDVVWVKNQELEGKVGAEYWVWPEHFAIRAGANSANDPGNGLTAGAAFRWNDLTVDYAYVPSGDIGDQNLFSLGYEFGPVRRRPGGSLTLPPPVRPSTGLEPPANADRRDDAFKLPPEILAMDLSGGIVDQFVLRSGGAEFEWMAEATAEVIRHQWKKDAFLAAARSKALFALNGSLWVVDDKLIVSATLTRQNALVTTFEVTGAAAAPFDAWRELVRKVNKTLAGLGYGVTIPEVRPPAARPQSAPLRVLPVEPRETKPQAQSKSPEPSRPPARRTADRPAPPVAAAESRPDIVVTKTPPPAYRLFFSSVREYPSFKNTAAAQDFQQRLEASFKALDGAIDPKASRRVEVTLSPLGEELIIYVKISDRASGLPVATLEIHGQKGESELPRKVIDAILWKM